MLPLQNKKTVTDALSIPLVMSVEWLGSPQMTLIGLFGSQMDGSHHIAVELVPNWYVLESSISLPIGAPLQHNEDRLPLE